MDPVGMLAQNKTVAQADVIDQDAAREQELNAIVARARRLRPRRRYPTKVANADLMQAAGGMARAAFPVPGFSAAHSLLGKAMSPAKPPAAPEPPRPDLGGLAHAGQNPGFTPPQVQPQSPTAAAVGQDQPPAPPPAEASPYAGAAPPEQQFMEQQGELPPAMPTPTPEGMPETTGMPGGAPDHGSGEFSQPWHEQLGQWLGQGGQSVANMFGQGAGDWYKNLSPAMQQWGVPLGAGAGGLMALYALQRMMRGGGNREQLYKTSNLSGLGPEALGGLDVKPDPSTLAAMLMYSGLGATAGGAATGAGIGAGLGGVAGAARGNVPEGVGRGVLRGGAAGGGAALGGLLGPVALAAMSKATGSPVNPTHVPLASMAGAGLGGYAGWRGSGALLGPAEAEQEKQAALRKAANALLGVTEQEDKAGEEAWKSVPGAMPSTKTFAPFETSNSQV